LRLHDGDRSQVLARREPGELFGEMSILDDQPRSATAVAVEDVLLMVVDRAQLTARLDAADPVLRLCIRAVLGHARDNLRRLAGGDVPLPSPPPPELVDESLAALRLEFELERGLQQHQFELVYQPLIHLISGDIVGHEALLRWRHPERGLVPPALFIPAAERTGLIRALTRWVLRRAPGDASYIHDDSYDGEGGRYVAVNVSAADVLADDFVAQLEAAALRTNRVPHALRLEVTERLWMRSPRLARERMQAARDLGISVAIDDFGTGYSSLSYLHELPADAIKIDKSFISALPDLAAERLITAIVVMAHDQDLEVVAEGVETAEQLEIVAELGVDVGQGFLFARPLTIEDAMRESQDWTPLSRGG